MMVRFWGVRGSFPAPGTDTCRIGGNTACVSVESDGQVLVLDAGTGIWKLGETLVGSRSEITLFASHLHLDHVIGIPFFGPLYEEGRTVNLVPVRTEGGPLSPLEVINGVYFPRHRRELPATFHIVEDEAEFLRERGFDLACLDLEHPGGSTGFRISRGSKSLVYMTDNELGATSGEGTRWADFVEFAWAADLLCHDAQYRADEIEEKRGWGHSTVEEACELAIEAGVKHLVLFHHDPGRTDDSVALIEEKAKEAVGPHGIRCTAAFEGLSLDLS